MGQLDCNAVAFHTPHPFNGWRHTLLPGVSGVPFISVLMRQPGCGEGQPAHFHWNSPKTTGYIFFPSRWTVTLFSFHLAPSLAQILFVLPWKKTINISTSLTYNLYLALIILDILKFGWQHIKWIKQGQHDTILWAYWHDKFGTKKDNIPILMIYPSGEDQAAYNCMTETTRLLLCAHLGHSEWLIYWLSSCNTNILGIYLTTLVLGHHGLTVSQSQSPKLT